MRKKTSRVLIAMSVLITGSLAYVGGIFTPSQQPAGNDDHAVTAGVGNDTRDSETTLITIDADETVASLQTASPDVGDGAGTGTRGHQDDGEAVGFLIEPVSGDLDGTGTTPGDGAPGPNITGGPAYSTPAVGQPSQDKGPGGPPSTGGPTTANGPSTSGGPSTAGAPPVSGGPSSPGAPAGPGGSDGDPTGVLPPGGGQLPTGPLLTDLPSDLPMLLDVPGGPGTRSSAPYPPAGSGNPVNGTGEGTGNGPGNTTGPGGPGAQRIANNGAAPGVSVASPSALTLLSAGLLGVLLRLRSRS